MLVYITLFSVMVVYQVLRGEKRDMDFTSADMEQFARLCGKKMKKNRYRFVALHVLLVYHLIYYVACSAGLMYCSAQQFPK